MQYSNKLETNFENLKNLLHEEYINWIKIVKQVIKSSKKLNDKSKLIEAKKLIKSINMYENYCEEEKKNRIKILYRTTVRLLGSSMLDVDNIKDNFTLKIPSFEPIYNNIFYNLIDKLSLKHIMNIENLKIQNMINDSIKISLKTALYQIIPTKLLETTQQDMFGKIVTYPIESEEQQDPMLEVLKRRCDEEEEERFRLLKKEEEDEKERQRLIKEQEEEERLRLLKKEEEDERERQRLIKEEEERQRLIKEDEERQQEAERQRKAREEEEYQRLLKEQQEEEEEKKLEEEEKRLQALKEEHERKRQELLKKKKKQPAITITPPPPPPEQPTTTTTLPIQQQQPPPPQPPVIEDIKLEEDKEEEQETESIMGEEDIPAELQDFINKLPKDDKIKKAIK